MKPVVKKKLDIFNLFYSGAAVVILIGVIAKLLEWPAQDLLITGGCGFIGSNFINYYFYKNEIIIYS